MSLYLLYIYIYIYIGKTTLLGEGAEDQAVVQSYLESADYSVGNRQLALHLMFVVCYLLFLNHL